MMSRESKRNALQLAEDDLRAGDYGQARQRLEGYLASKGYDPQLMGRLGRISYEMHDLYNAGRHWLLSTAQGEEVDRSIQVFLKRAGTHPHQIGMQVLRTARLPSFSDYPAAVQERLNRLGLKDSFDGLLGRKQSYKVGKIGILFAGLFFLGMVLFLLLSIVGTIAVANWLTS